jgi:hypothetical protein
MFTEPKLKDQSELEELRREIIPWWVDQHHWNPMTLFRMPLHQVRAIKRRMIAELTAQKNKPLPKEPKAVQVGLFPGEKQPKYKKGR